MPQDATGHSTDPFDAVAEAARRLKVETTAEHGDDPDDEACDLRTFVCASRGQGQPFVQVFVGPGPSAAREACYYTAMLMRAHDVWLVSDARYTTERSLADHLGSLQERWEAGERSGITEVLVIYRVPKLGKPTMVQYPYVRHGRQVEWLEPVWPDKGTMVGGALPDAIQRGFANAHHVAEAYAETLKVIPIDHEDAERAADRAAAQMLTQFCPGATVLLGGADGQLLMVTEGDE